jgi:protein-disulfide isomerase
MAKQLLHLVFGGELAALDKVEFRDLDKVHFVGLYPNYAKAREAWKAAAQATVDNAHMRYFVVHLHRLLQPDELPAPPVKKASAPSRAAKSGGKPAKGRNRK